MTKTQRLWDCLSFKLKQLPPEKGLGLSFTDLIRDTGLTKLEILGGLSILQNVHRYIEVYLLGSEEAEEGVEDRFQIDPRR